MQIIWCFATNRTQLLPLASLIRARKDNIMILIDFYSSSFVFVHIFYFRDFHSVSLLHSHVFASETRRIYDYFSGVPAQQTLMTTFKRNKARVRVGTLHTTLDSSKSSTDSTENYTKMIFWKSFSVNIKNKSHFSSPMTLHIFRHPLRLKRAGCVCKWRLSWVQWRTLTKNMLRRAEMETWPDENEFFESVFMISRTLAGFSLPASESRPKIGGQAWNAAVNILQWTLLPFLRLSHVLCSFSCACFSSSRLKTSEDFLHFANGHRAQLFESLCHKFWVFANSHSQNEWIFQLNLRCYFCEIEKPFFFALRNIFEIHKQI